MSRFGAQLVGVKCKQAQRMQLRGTVQSRGTEPAWAGTAAESDNWRAVGRPVLEESGAFAQPNDPKNIRFVRLGADRWGWIENEESSGQGETYGLVSVHLLQDGAAREVPHELFDQDNTGACDDTMFGHAWNCMTKLAYTVSASPDLSNPDAAAYPIVLHAHGTLGGPLDRTLKIPFDDRTGKYPEPKDWP